MARQGRAKALTIDEFRRAEKAALLTKHPLRNRALLYMSFSLALRACELRRLRIKDVLAPDGTIIETINLLNTMTKGKKQRFVYLTNKKTKAILKEYIDYLIEKANKNRKPFCMDDLLFQSQKGGEFLQQNIVRVFRAIYKMAGIIGAKSHSGRVTFITQKINEGYALANISLIVGHADIRTTVGYYEKNEETLKRIAEKSIF